MTKRHLARLVNKEQIARAVADAEAGTSGEIVVSISPFFWGSVDAAARRAFARLGVDRTAERNGVLLFIVPSRRRFVILGDDGVHARVGQTIWDEIAAIMAGELRASADLSPAIVRGVALIGTALAEKFPRRGPKQNVLGDDPELRRS